MFIHSVNLDAWRLFGTIKGRRQCPTNNTALLEDRYPTMQLTMYRISRRHEYRTSVGKSVKINQSEGIPESHIPER